MRPRIPLLLALAISFACTGVAPDESIGGPGGEDVPGDPTPSGPEPCSMMDIVFIIDNSGSMAEEQSNLVANFSKFAELIDGYQNSDGDFLDYRLAIGTAGRDVSYSIKLPPPFSDEIAFNEPGDNGVFRQSCGMNRRWIERDDGNVVDTFSCAANVGTSGPGAEMPLLGLEWGLGRRVEDGTNAGFLREDALLAVVMLSDQDDCSREDDGFVIDGGADTCYDPNDSAIISLDHYLGFLDDIKGGRQRWATAVMAGPGPGPCESSFGTAAEATRLGEFVNATGENARFSSICDGDLTSALEDALDTFAEACEAFPPVE